jgi:O-antigen/teichoic acid export membrane protein
MGCIPNLPVNSIDSEYHQALSIRVIQGSIWLFGLKLVNRGLGLIRKIVLARLLAPEDFGLFGIALLSISTLEILSQTGTHEALIQKKGNTDSLLNSAWTVSVIRGLILSAILFISAPIFANFFHSPQAVAVIRIIGISPLILGFTNIGIVYFQKELEFNKQVYYELTVALMNFFLALLLAFFLKNVWALVWSGLVAGLTRTFMSYAVHPYRPRLHLDTKQVGELIGFGKWVLASSILVFLNSQGDDIMVGKLLGVAALGLYQMAYTISNLPTTEITHIISRVTFPAYSKIRDDSLRLKSAYLKVSQLIGFISAPVAGIIVILAPEFTTLILGEKWMEMVTAMQVLAIWGFIRSIGATTGPIFYSIGKPEVATRLQLFQLILLVIFIYPLSKGMGILGTSLSVVLAAVPPNIAAVSMVFKIFGSGLQRFISGIVFPVIAASLTMLGLALLKFNHLFDVTLLIFITYGAIFIFLYLASLLLLDRFFDYRLGELVLTIKQEFKK